MRIRLRTSKAYWECGTFQPDNLGTMGLMSTLEEIETAVQQMEDDMTTGKLDWLTN